MAHPQQLVEVCDPSRMICPSCKAPQRRLHILWGATVSYCSTKTNRPGERCNTWLAIIVDGPSAIVTALNSSAEADRVVEHYRELRMKAVAAQGRELVAELAGVTGR